MFSRNKRPKSLEEQCQHWNWPVTRDSTRWFSWLLYHNYSTTTFHSLGAYSSLKPALMTLVSFTNIINKKKHSYTPSVLSSASLITTVMVLKTNSTTDTRWSRRFITNMVLKKESIERLLFVRLCLVYRLSARVNLSEACVRKAASVTHISQAAHCFIEHYIKCLRRCSCYCW